MSYIREKTNISFDLQFRHSHNAYFVEICNEEIDDGKLNKCVNITKTDTLNILKPNTIKIETEAFEKIIEMYNALKDKVYIENEE